MSTKLGQNFLHDEKVLEEIIAAADLRPDDLVIEIGPGEGVLTEELAKRAGKVVAVEIDEVLSSLLRNKFSNKKNVEIINEDVLKINLAELINCHSERSPAVGGINSAESKNLIRSLDKLGMTPCSYKVIANLPYYITSPIIRLFLESEFPPKEMILMIQKEVAERIVAKPGKMSILAVSVQYYAEAELLFYVSKNSFHPAPEVDSAVIRITPSPPSPGFQPPSPLIWRGGEGDKKFFRVVRAGFSAKRKMLINNLTNAFHLDKLEVEEKLKKAGISPTARAQELSIEQWKILSEIFI